MLWQLIEVFRASHSARLQEASKSIDRLIHINPTVWTSQEFKKFKRYVKSYCQNDIIKSVKIARWYIHWNFPDYDAILTALT